MLARVGRDLYHVGVTIQGVDMLGDFLDWVSGEHAEATANDSAEKKLLLNNQKSKEGRTQPSSPSWSPGSNQ